jgi:hypothetical protein
MSGDLELAGDVQMRAGTPETRQALLNPAGRREMAVVFEDCLSFSGLGDHRELSRCGGLRE